MGPAFSAFGVDREQFFGTLTEMNDAKVGAAAFLGTSLPAANLFLGDAEPIFRILALVGQLAVAVVTTIYIWKKIKR